MRDRSLHFQRLAIALSSALLLQPEVVLAETDDGTTTLKAVVVQGSAYRHDDVQPEVGDAHKETAAASKGTLTKAQLEKLVGLDSPITGALKYLPGVHSSGGDNSGISEGSLNIRGFSQDQMGFVRDGVPLNDPQFLTPHADFLGDPENYESVSVLYGSSSIDAPTLTASGGSVVIRSVAPTQDAGILFKENAGSNDLLRTFARVNTGYHNGFSAWFSASRTSQHLWDDSEGDESANRYEGNLQYEWGNGNRINAIFSSFLMYTNSYNSPTLAGYHSSSYHSGYPRNIYPTLGGTAGVADSTGVGQSAAASRADFKIQTYALNGLFNLSDNLQLKVNPYFVRVARGTASVAVLSVSELSTGSDLNGDGDTIDPAIPGALAVYPTQYRIGSTNSLDITINDTQTLQLGAWTDYTHAANQMPIIQISRDGKPAASNGSDPLRNAEGTPLYTTNQWNEITTQKLWVQDSWYITQDLNLIGGVAWQHTQLKGDDRLTGFRGTADYNRFLPSLSLNYRLDNHNQIYYDTTYNMRVPAVASVYGLSDGSAKQKSELTWNQEIGWRYSTERLLVSAALFYDRFKDRQISFEELTGVTSYFNAGDVITEGLELAINGVLSYHFNYFGSWSYLSSKQQDNYSVDGRTLETSGKQLYDTPRQLLSAGIGYDDQTFYANVLGHYTSSFYGDLANSERIGGYVVFDASFGYRLNLKTRLTLNINNLFDNHYLAGLKAGTVSANPDDGSFYTAPTYYRGAPRTFVAGIAIEF